MIVINFLLHLNWIFLIKSVMVRKSLFYFLVLINCVVDARYSNHGAFWWGNDNDKKRTNTTAMLRLIDKIFKLNWLLYGSQLSSEKGNFECVNVLKTMCCHLRNVYCKLKKKTSKEDYLNKSKLLAHSSIKTSFILGLMWNNFYLSTLFIRIIHIHL